MCGVRCLLVGACCVILLSAGALALMAEPGSSARPIPDAAVSARALSVDDRCPRALAPSARAAERAVRAVRAQVPRLFPNFELDRYGYHVVVLLSLDAALVAEPISRKRYVRVAADACGSAVADRSWVVILHFPGAPMASLVPVVVYVARTADGWRPWYKWTPNFGGKGFIGK
jgi:hypothetical protein